MKRFVFRIRKPYFEAIVRGEKTVEYRVDSPFWRVRFGIHSELDRLTPILAVQLARHDMGEGIAVFICGKRTHRRRIVDICYEKRPVGFTAQGLSDVSTDHCFAIYLGEEISWT